MTAYLERPEGRIGYDLQGKGPLLICLPAGGDLRSSYRYIDHCLATSGYRVATMDLRGLGDSSSNWTNYSAQAVASDIFALMDELGAQSATLISSSVSCAAALVAASQAPERIDGLVLNGSFAQAAPAWKLQAISNLALNPLFGRTLFLQFQSKLYRRKPLDFEAYRQQVAAMLNDPQRLRALRLLFSEVGEWDTQIEALRVPTMICMGSQDRDFADPAGEAAKLAQRMQHAPARIQLFEGAGHYPYVEMPERFLQELHHFLSESVYALEREV